MTVIRFITVLLVVSRWIAFAGDADSLSLARNGVPGESKLYRLDEVIVSASRSEILRSESPVAADVVSAARLQERNAESLSDALSGTPGIFIKDYGGSNIKTMAMRGMTAENTVVLFDGIRLSSMQNPAIDLGDIPVELVQRIEIVRSGNSAVVGADAGAGSVNIVFPQGSSRPSLSLHSSIGSFGTKKGGISLNQTIGPIEMTGGAFIENSAGNYPFTISDYPSDITRSRNNNDLHRTNLLLSLSSVAAQSSSMKLLGWYSESDRGVPEAVISQTPSDGTARQRDRDFRLLLSYGFPLAASLRGRVSADLQKTYERYTDPEFDAGAGPLDNYTVNTMGGVTAQLDYALTPENILVLGTEMRRYVVGGNELSMNPDRSQQSVYATYEFRLRNVLSGIETVCLLPVIRYDAFSDIGSRISPKFAVSIRTNPAAGWGLKDADLTLRGSIGNNFRVPTFNELYWAGSGNPNLRPENSTSGEAGIVYRNEWALPHTFELTWFDIMTTDRIVWVPGVRNIWSPMNIGKVLSRGIELSGKIETSGGIWSVEGNYSLMRTTKENREGGNDPAYGRQLPFIPREMAALSMRYGPRTSLDWLPKVFVRMEYRFTGFRFTTAENDPSTVLHPYGVLDTGIGGDVAAGLVVLKLTASVRNILDRNFEIMPGYPMPRRNFLLSLSVQY